MLPSAVGLRVLHWSGNKQLPAAQSRMSNAALIFLTGAVAIVLLLDIEFLAVFHGIKENVLLIIEGVDILTLVVVVLIAVMIFRIIQIIGKSRMNRA